jgi:hypothetical protein
MNKLNQLLQILQDGQWHDIKKLATTLEITTTQLEGLTQTLKNHEIIQQNHETNQIKLNQQWKTLLIEENNPQNPTTPEKTAVGTLIIPPQKTILIQCTRITNLTDTSLELEIRIDNKLREIAINKITQNQN